MARIEALVGLLREIGQAHDGKTPAQVALNWLMCQGVVPIPGAKNLIAVGSGKGGGGKTTVSVNLAISLAQKYKPLSFFCRER